MSRFLKKCMAGFVAAAMVTASVNLPAAVCGAETTQWSDDAAVFTFTDSSVSVEGNDDGYSVTGTAVTIEAAGDYIFQGECSDGSITVKKDSGEVNLYLNGLTLEAQAEGTCPLSLKGGDNEITITAVDGTVNDLSDCDHSQASPKSVINASKAITINGGGTINIDANNKNGIKSDTDLTIEGDVSLNVDSVGDGIVADENLTISGGDISIKTNGGHTTVLSDDADSSKAIKSDSKITIAGGDISIDSSDDAIHSGEYIYLLGGNMEIYTGDDGAHADTSLFLGSESGGCPIIDIKSSYEGLEAGTVYIYSGDIDVVSSDDGINAAGGSDSTDTSSGNFNPGGGAGGGPSRGGFGGFGRNDDNTQSSSTGDYSINIYGGDIYVNAEGDGVDSNGNLNMSGGKLVVFGAASNGSNSDNSALDYDGSCLVTGGILFAAGSYPRMESIVPSSGSQAYSVSTSTVTKGRYINVYNNGTAVFSVLAPKQVAHCIYSAPTGSGWTFQSGTNTEAFTCSHTNTTVLNKTEATADTNSYSGDVYCADCGALITAGTYGNDATGEETDEQESSEESAAEQSSAEESAAEQSSAEESAAEQSSAEESAAEQSSAEESAAEQSSAEESAAEQSSAEESSGAQESEEQKTDSGDAADTPQQVPGKANISSISTTTKGIRLVWSKATDATGYIIYRGKAGGKLSAYKTISSANTRTFTDKKVKNGTKYQYKIRTFVQEGSVKTYGSYSAVKTRYYLSRPVIKKLTASASKQITVKWKKNAKGTGYQIRFGTSKSFSSAKTLTVKKKSTLSKVITGLKANKTYYVKIRSVKKVNSKKYYSAWSKVKSVKTRK